jgi:hypothetical protein
VKWSIRNVLKPRAFRKARFSDLSPWFFHVNDVITILGGDDEADADEWYLWFGIQRPMDDSNRFRIGVTGLVMASGVFKFDSDSPLQY